MSAEPRYCHKCKAWHSPTDAGWQAGCASELSPALGSDARTPAESFPVGSFILDEMQERGWSVEELVRQMRADAVGQLTIELLIYAPTKGATLDERTASQLAHAFGTSKELWLRLDRAWQQNAELTHSGK